MFLKVTPDFYSRWRQKKNWRANEQKGVTNKLCANWQPFGELEATFANPNKMIEKNKNRLQ